MTKTLGENGLGSSLLCRESHLAVINCRFWLQRFLTNPKLATKLASRRYVGTPYISGGVMIEVDELLRTLGMVTLDTWPLADWYKFQISSS